MRVWVENKWDVLRTNFWVLPGMMALLSIAACLFLLRLDAELSYPLSWLTVGSLDSARALLAAMIGAVMTALSVVFSITIVALTLAASQLGPRLLRNFMRDPSNQRVLGVFVATLTYCLTALFAVGGANPSIGLPNVTVLGAFALTLCSIAALVFFIHHIAQSIQAPNVVLAVSRELDDLIERMYPEKAKEGHEGVEDDGDEVLGEARVVPAERSDYIQAIDIPMLMNTARDQSVILQTLRHPGDFVIEGEPLANVYSAEEVTGPLANRIRSTFIMGGDRTSAFPIELMRGPLAGRIRSLIIMGGGRTATQDIEFLIMQLVEMATRALSPGINDPITAGNCIERLGAALCRIQGRHIPLARHYDEDGQLRLITDRVTFARLCDVAFDQIRQYGGGSASVLIRLLEILDVMAHQARTEEQRRAVWRHANMAHRAAAELPEPLDRSRASERHKAIEHCLQPKPSLPRDEPAPGQAEAAPDAAEADA